MSNPLMQMMSGTTPAQSGPRGATNAFQLAQQFMHGKTPQQAFQALLQSDPQFREFMSANKGKTPAQYAKEHGLDLGRLMTRM